MIELDLKPVTAKVGAEALAVKLSDGVTPELASAVADAVAIHGVIFFREQHLSLEDHRAFAHAMGPVRSGGGIENADPNADDIKILSTDNEIAYSAAEWHTDHSADAEPAEYSILNAVELPSVGGDTMWASSAAAFEGLSPEMQRFLIGKTAWHQYPVRGYAPGREQQGYNHPVVCEHPRTGRPTLFVNRMMTKHINEVSRNESAALLNFLFEHTVLPEYTCRWRWTVGDVAIWNNPYTQHCAVYDYGTERRTVHRIQVEGGPIVPATGSGTLPSS